VRAATVAVPEGFLLGNARPAAFAVERGPVRVVAQAAFVADPADVRAAVAEANATGLQLADQRPGLGPLIVRLVVDRPSFASPAVVSVAAVGPVIPALEDLAVVGHQFAELIAVVLDVCIAGVFRVIPVPRRQIDAELQAVLAAGVGA